MAIIIPVTSGKGGTGKSIFALNISIALAYKKKKVILIDLNLGSSDIHTLFGVESTTPGIGNIIFNKARSIKHLIMETEIYGLYFIPGHSLFPGTANLKKSTREKIIKQIQLLEADYIILDLGSGCSDLNMDFFLISYPGILITTVEQTSIQDTYYFLKSILYYQLINTFPQKSKEREAIKSFVLSNNEENNFNFLSVIDKVSQISSKSGKILMDKIRYFFSRVIINKAGKKEDIQEAYELRNLIRKNLGISVEYTGFFLFDEAVRLSVEKRVPVYIYKPDSYYSISINNAALRIITNPYSAATKIYTQNKDLEKLSLELENMMAKKEQAL